MHRTALTTIPLSLLLLTAGGVQAEPVALRGPLAEGEGRISGRGMLSLALLPKDDSKPIEVFGKPIPVTVELLATGAKQGDHPFELFAAVFLLDEAAPVPAESAAEVGTTIELLAEPPIEEGLASPLIRCGTITAESAPAVPGGAITAQVIEPTWRELKENPERQARAIYSVAATERVTVGIVDFPLIAQAAMLEDTVQRQIPSITFTISIAAGEAAHFYAETPFTQGTLIMKVDIPNWEYPEPAVAPTL